MPLLDHFHPPLLDDPPWTSLYTLWVANVVRWLNRTLPASGFRAFANVRLGPHVEADVAEYLRQPTNGVHEPTSANGIATMPATLPATASFPFSLPDDVEVQIAESRHHMTIAGVIEFISPANKKEANERQAFVEKCATYLHRGIGVVIVDVVTNRLANLHNDLMALVSAPPSTHLRDAPTYVAGYAPVTRGGRTELDVWPFPATIGQPIPSALLSLRRGPQISLDLEATYLEAIADSGL